MEESREETVPEPVSKMNIEVPDKGVEESMETEEDDSLEDLCNDVMPSPTKEVLNFMTAVLTRRIFHSQLL